MRALSRRVSYALVGDEPKLLELHHEDFGFGPRYSVKLFDFWGHEQHDEKSTANPGEAALVWECLTGEEVVFGEGCSK